VCARVPPSPRRRNPRRMYVHRPPPFLVACFPTDIPSSPARSSPTHEHFAYVTGFSTFRSCRTPREALLVYTASCVFLPVLTFERPLEQSELVERKSNFRRVDVVWSLQPVVGCCCLARFPVYCETDRATRFVTA